MVKGTKRTKGGKEEWGCLECDLVVAPSRQSMYRHRKEYHPESISRKRGPRAPNDGLTAMQRLRLKAKKKLVMP